MPELAKEKSRYCVVVRGTQLSLGGCNHIQCAKNNFKFIEKMGWGKFLCVMDNKTGAELKGFVETDKATGKVVDSAGETDDDKASYVTSYESGDPDEGVGEDAPDTEDEFDDIPPAIRDRMRSAGF